LQFFALRAVKLRFSAVAVAKLKFCNSLHSMTDMDTEAVPKLQFLEQAQLFSPNQELRAAGKIFCCPVIL
jgi:hypothetical protein